MSEDAPSFEFDENGWHLYNPWLGPDGAFEVDVSDAYGERLKSADATYAARTLEAFGLGARAKKASMVLARTHFLSSYSDSEEWQDRWRSVHLLRIPLSGKPDWSNALIKDVRSHQEGSLKPGGNPFDQAALVVAVAMGTPKEIAELKKLAGKLVRASGLEAQLSVRVQKGRRKLWSVARILVKSARFPRDVEKLDALVRGFDDAGTLINHSQLDRIDALDVDDLTPKSKAKVKPEPARRRVARSRRVRTDRLRDDAYEFVSQKKVIARLTWRDDVGWVVHLNEHRPKVRRLQSESSLTELDRTQGATAARLAHDILVGCEEERLEPVSQK